MKYLPVEKILAKNLKIPNSEAKVLFNHVVQALKDSLLKHDVVDIPQLGKFSVGYYPEKKMMHTIYKKVVTCFPFRKVFFKISDEFRVLLNPHERYTKRINFKTSAHINQKKNQILYKEKYDIFVKSYVKYQKLKLLHNMSFEEYLELQRKDETNEIK